MLAYDGSDAAPINSFQLPPVSTNTMQMLSNKKQKDQSVRAWDSSTQIKKHRGAIEEQLYERRSGMGT